MERESVLVVGLGEVGRCLFELLKESGRFEVYGFDVDEDKMRDLKQSSLPDTVDVLHVCFPCADKEEFVEDVAIYMLRFKPELVIINSTVAPGTTHELYRKYGRNCLMVHSPVRGVYKSLDYMKWELKRWTKYIGGVNREAAELAEKHFGKLGLKTKVLRSCLESELAKLFETTYRAWMIVCFQEMHRISRDFGADFADVVDFLEDTHKVRFDRPVMYPDVIRGHCLIPNVKLLLKGYDSNFLRLILESNKKREKEIEDENVKKDVERIKQRVERLDGPS